MKHRNILKKTASPFYKKMLLDLRADNYVEYLAPSIERRSDVADVFSEIEKHDYRVGHVHCAESTSKYDDFYQKIYQKTRGASEIWGAEIHINDDLPEGIVVCEMDRLDEYLNQPLNKLCYVQNGDIVYPNIFAIASLS